MKHIMDIENLINTIIQASYEVKKNLVPGYLEIVYRRSLAQELRLRGINCIEEMPITVHYKGVAVGDYRADIVVEDSVILELKVVDALTTAHEVQLVNYLTSTGLDHGLLINFGNYSEKPRRKWRVYTPPVKKS